MPRGRPVPKLSLTVEERETLQRWARRPKTAQALALRARVVLACAEEKSNTAVSAYPSCRPIAARPGMCLGQDVKEG